MKQQSVIVGKTNQRISEIRGYQKMVSQFAALERRTFSTGRERIDPGPGHDDLCDSAAIAHSVAVFP
jgi:hypothetical protein